jgi:MFS family permease
VLAVPAVRHLWLAGVGAGVMRWLEILAFGLHALALTGSPLVVALMSFARFLPLLLLGAPAGVLAERFDRRRLLVTAYLLMAAIQALAALAAVLDLFGLGHALALALAGGVFWCFEIPVRRTFLAEAGGTDRMAVSMGLEMVTTHLTRVAGPALGGLLVATAGMPGVLLLGAILYASGALLLLNVPAAPGTLPMVRQHLGAALAEGFRAVRAEPRLLAIAVLTVVFNLFGLPYLGLLPVLAVERLDLGPFGTGVLAAGEGVGAVIATILLLRWSRPRWFAPIFGLGCLIFFAGVLALAAAPTAEAAFVILLVAGFGMSGFSVMQATLPLAIVPAAMRIRVAGVIMVSIGSAPFGFLLAGALGGPLGGSGGIALLGTTGLLATALALWRWPVMALPRRA